MLDGLFLRMCSRSICFGLVLTFFDINLHPIVFGIGSGNFQGRSIARISAVNPRLRAGTKMVNVKLIKAHNTFISILSWDPSEISFGLTDESMQMCCYFFSDSFNHSIDFFIRLTARKRACKLHLPLCCSSQVATASEQVNIDRRCEHCTEIDQHGEMVKQRTARKKLKK